MSEVNSNFNIEKNKVSDDVRIISIQSGKGGTGKTLIAASIGFLLAHCGHRTLLIDTDLITRGLSFFLMGDEPYRAKYGLSDYLTDDSPISDQNLINIRSPFCNSNLYFLPSSSKLQSHAIDKYPYKDFQKILSNRLNYLYDVAFNRYQFKYIICDTPGGSSPISHTVANTVKGYVIITEADKTSWDVTELLINGIIQYGSNNNNIETNKIGEPARLGFVLNKNTLPEKEIVSFLKQRFLCRDLAVIPLDIEAVRCFQNDEIPVEKEINSIFSDKIFDIVDKLYNPDYDWVEDKKSVFGELKANIKKKRLEIQRQERVSEKFDNFRQFVGPFTIGLISMIAAAFTFLKIDLSRNTMTILLVFIAYMATLSAVLSNPKFLKTLFKHRDKEKKGSNNGAAE